MATVYLLMLCNVIKKLHGNWRHIVGWDFTLKKHCINGLFWLGLACTIGTYIERFSSGVSNRAIYFAAYSTAKEKMNTVLEPDSTQVHMVSAGMAGNYMRVVTG